MIFQPTVGFMKTLYLIRHAKSSWKNADLADFDRPLNSRRRRDAPEMGRRLHQRQITPDAVLSSPARRAQSTALAIAEAVGFDPQDIAFRPSLYHASPEVMMKEIQRAEDSVSSLFLIGHNPGLTRLANSLCTTPIENIVTCGVYVLGFNADSWPDILLEKSAERLWYDYPKRKA